MAKATNNEARTGWLLVSPPALYTLLILAAPLLLVVGLSLTGVTSGKLALPLKEGQIDQLHFTFANYAKFFTQPIYQTVMLRSLLVASLVTLTTVALAYPIAYFVSFHVSPSKKSLWLFLITIPFWTSYVIRVALWRTILGYEGVVDSMLMGLGFINEPLNILQYGVTSIVMTLSHAYAPFAVLPIFVALEKVDRSLLEAGQDLGESRLMTFIRVTLPLTMPGVLAAFLIVFIPTVGDYVTPELIGGGKVPMVSNLVETQMWKLRDQAMGSAVAVTSMVIVSLISLAFILMNWRFVGGRK